MENDGEPGLDPLAYGDWLFRRPAEFVKGVVRIADLPSSGTPEIAFAGRSNVGKSSLINGLLHRRNLARASNTPGRTRELNFFDLGAGALSIVDMPGYGYAKAPKGQVAGWNRLIEDYLKGRQSLARVVLLIDARHGVKENDRATMKLLDAAAQSYISVLTKSDKPGKAELARIAAATEAELAKHPAAYPGLFVTSSETGAGLPELRAALAALAAR
jgi:GTP-binding protein